MHAATTGSKRFDERLLAAATADRARELEFCEALVEGRSTGNEL